MKANVKLVWRFSGPIRSLNYFNLKTKYIATFAFFKGVGLSQTPGTDQIDIFNLRHSSLISNKL